MTEVNKRGSSRRKGDEYQDVTALRFALENYIACTPFKMFLDYEKVGNLDDIVLFQGNRISAYQVKYAVNPLDVYKPNDLTDLSSKVNFKKFSGSWNTIKEKFPEHSITVYLLSNRALDSALVDLLTPDGAFKPEVVENRRYKEARKLRSQLEHVSGLDPDSFREFLKDFRFCVKQKELEDLEQYIQTVLLNKELGLSDTSIFFGLKEFIKNNAIFSRNAITNESVDELLERFKSKSLIPQTFPVNQKHLVAREYLSNQLDEVLPQVNGEYLIVTGLPGSGKSTSLTAYFNVQSSTKCEVFSYYCFVGVNDNAQRMRVQAETLRENLLSEFHRRYPDVLKRRFDYSELNFYESLKTLASFFVKQDRQLVIFLDGLDHAERLEQEVRDTVISALPSDVPNGVTFVVSTQELHKWPHFLKRVKECPENHIQMPLFSQSETQDYLENKRQISGLLHADIIDIHNKCEGLPLYLQYAAETLLAADVVSDAIDSLTPAEHGDIHNYYHFLWEEFDRLGVGDTRHLCAVMACMRFSLHREELFSIQDFLTPPQFEDAYRRMSHLLRDSEYGLSVFHNSFREFVVSQLEEDYLKGIKRNIADFLKESKSSPKWFGYVFEYCYEARDCAYVIQEVNADFVDRALLHYRPSEEIMDAIQWAVESAFKLQDIVQLSRLGSLKYRTHERLEDNLDRGLLADTLLALGRDQDVTSFAYSPESNCWIVDLRTSLAVMSALAENGRLRLGRKLFDVFMDEFRGIDSDDMDETRLQVNGIARCWGIYSEHQACPLRWLSGFNLTRGIMEQTDPYAPGYAPHLSAYIDALVQFKRREKWNRLKRVKKIFPNGLVRYLLIRALARHGLLDDLRITVTEYVEQEPPCGNVELAFYAAKAGMPASEVSAIAGLIQAPRTSCPDHLQWKDPILRHYAYSFIVLCYEDDKASYENLCETVGTSQTLWTGVLQHLLKACYCIARSFRGDSNDWYADACESIDLLVHAKQGDRERIIELTNIIRDLLPFTIGLLTEEVQKRFPNQLDDWVEKLASLRDSLLWNTHFGISESIQDYEFELNLWETLARNSAVATKLTSILKSCAATYKQSTMLKSGSRSNHFMRLAAIMAKCDMREDAGKWLRYGIRSSLIYGYRKDVTLSYLIDILELVNHHYPEKAFERCPRVLYMVDWMSHLTDDRETKWFAERAFSAILAVNRQAALELPKHFSQSKARWQMENCLRKYLLSAVDGDPEYLWCLSESLFDDSIETRQHIVDLIGKSCSEDVSKAFEDRFRNFVLTEINPKRWPDHLKNEFSIPLNSEDKNETNTGLDDHLTSEFMLDGKTVTGQEIVEKCKVSFSEFLTILEKLKTQNKHFYKSDLLEEVLRHHIAEAHSSENLISIKKYAEPQRRWLNSDIFEFLADRFLDFGDQDNALEDLAIAYASSRGSYYGENSTKFLASIAKRNKSEAKSYLLKKCYDSAKGSWGGYETPFIAAEGLNVLDEPHMLETVFSHFLIYCESMFAQLPQGNHYGWLKNYATTPFNENQLILEFSIDELDTPDIDHGERLIRALVVLAIARPQSVIPMLVSRTLSASRRLLRRLLMIFQVLATRNPDLLVSHQQMLARLLNKKDFLCCQSTVRILQRVGEVSTLEPSVAEGVERIERKYSTSISHSNYGMRSNPSPIFQNFLREKTQSHFSNQLELIEKILQVKPGSLVTTIEERLDIQNWSIDEEKSRIKDDWYKYVHPQGWPIVWITVEFQELVVEMLWNILDEAVEKLKLSPQQVEDLWRTIQTVDPDHVTEEIRTRPVDIESFNVVGKETWFEELDAVESFQVANIRNEQQNAYWVTVFEKRTLAQEEKFNVPYRQKTSLHPALIPQQVYGGLHKLDELEMKSERILPVSGMVATLEQVRNILIERGSDVLDTSEECLPLIARHWNPLPFFGYRDICTLTSFIIDEFNLSFGGLDLIKNNEVVAKYESWQEGYQNQQYTREKLSFGVRLQVRLDFLAEVCRRYRKILCILVNETREYYKHYSEQEPDTKKDSKRYVIYHL